MDPFADAQAWYERAQSHISEFRILARTRDPWSLHKVRQSEDIYAYSIKFNREWHIPLKPIACEAASALFQALDNIVGVAARDANVPRKPDVCWPFKIEDDPSSNVDGAKRPALEEGLAKLRKRGMPDEWLNLIQDTFTASPANLHAIDVVKEVSLSGKHWELVETGSNALAIAWHQPGQRAQNIVEVPEQHFEDNDDFTYHEGKEIADPRFRMVIGYRLQAEGKAYQPEPIAAFEATSRFVLIALEKARNLRAGITA